MQTEFTIGNVVKYEGIPVLADMDLKKRYQLDVGRKILQKFGLPDKREHLPKVLIYCILKPLLLIFMII